MMRGKGRCCVPRAGNDERRVVEKEAKQQGRQEERGRTREGGGAEEGKQRLLVDFGGEGGVEAVGGGVGAGGRDAAQGVAEVVEGNGPREAVLGGVGAVLFGTTGIVPGFLIAVAQVAGEFADGSCGGGAADFLEVGARVVFGDAGDVVEVDVAGERVVREENFEDTSARGDVREGDLKLAGEAAQDGGVQRVRPVRRGENDDAPVGAVGEEAVERRHELGFQRQRDVGVPRGSRREKAVDLVEEDDARRELGRERKDRAHELVGLAVVLVGESGRPDVQEGSVGVVCHGTRQHGLAAARRAVEQNAPRRPHELAARREELWSRQRQDHEIADFLNHFVQSADVRQRAEPRRVHDARRQHTFVLRQRGRAAVVSLFEHSVRGGRRAARRPGRVTQELVPRSARALRKPPRHEQHRVTDAHRDQRRHQTLRRRRLLPRRSRHAHDSFRRRRRRRRSRPRGGQLTSGAPRRRALQRIHRRERLHLFSVGGG
mmetsp:Transcript_14396/g.43609  ORF Transcript_14396/g.43609 Transcript_14396/m.43609 type:complete len:489 (+) Transcript_14396:537-2003(+)